MEFSRFKPLLPWIITLLLGTLLVVSLIDYAVTRLHIAFADDQTAIFEQMRRQVAESNSADVQCLQYVVTYYPSGTKQTTGTPLDRVVERARQSAIREIIATLRIRTGKDFGDNPKRWIERLRRD
jgi:hypothetical protein